MKRKNISSDSPWEDVVGYSRAVQLGDWLLISGTTAVLNGDVQFPGDARSQAIFIFNKIEEQLRACGMVLGDVVRTRMYVTDIQQWEAVAETHSQFFSQIKPAATMVEVNALIHPDLVIEIEVDAFRSIPE